METDNVVIFSIDSSLLYYMNNYGMTIIQAISTLMRLHSILNKALQKSTEYHFVLHYMIKVDACESKAQILHETFITNFEKDIKTKINPGKCLANLIEKLDKAKGKCSFSKKRKENEPHALIAIDVISKYILAISPNMEKKPTIILSFNNSNCSVFDNQVCYSYTFQSLDEKYPQYMFSKNYLYKPLENIFNCYNNIKNLNLVVRDDVINCLINRFI